MVFPRDLTSGNTMSLVVRNPAREERTPSPTPSRPPISELPTNPQQARLHRSAFEADIRNRLVRSAGGEVQPPGAVPARKKIEGDD